MVELYLSFSKTSLTEHDMFLTLNLNLSEKIRKVVIK